jgi:hypothetical protein
MLFGMRAGHDVSIRTSVGSGKVLLVVHQDFDGFGYKSPSKILHCTGDDSL